MRLTLERLLYFSPVLVSNFSNIGKNFSIQKLLNANRVLIICNRSKSNMQYHSGAKNDLYR